MAEIIGYDVIGQPKLEPINVIGYPVNEEMTIDGYADKNANNATTTGLADVIPGINGPKLIQSTSIYGDVEPTPFAYGATIVMDGNYIQRPQETSTNLLTMTINHDFGEQQFEYVDGGASYFSGLKIPTDGWFNIEVQYRAASSTFGFKYDRRFSRGAGTLSPTFHTFEGPYSSDRTLYKESFNAEFTEGDIIRIFVTILRSGSTSLAAYPSADVIIKRIA